MKNLKNIVGFIIVLGLSWAAWNAWFPPQIIDKQQDVRAWIPERPHLGALENEKWRVFTKRMVWKKAVEDLQAKFKENNRSYMTVGIGCTGGQHRSVYLSERLFEALRPTWSNVQVKHRELGKTLGH